MANKRTNINCRVFTVFMLIIIVSTLTTAGCSKKLNSANPQLSEISEKINQSADMSNMQKGDIGKLEQFYDIDVDDLEDFVLHTSSSNIKADEIAIFKVSFS